MLRKAQVAPRCREKGCDPGTVGAGINKLNVYKREHIFLKPSHCAETEPALKKSKCFYQNVIAGNQGVLRIKYLSPCNAGFFMVGVSPIEQCKKS
jgi:hypothetical protein